MEDRYQHTLNGQSVLQADLNVLGETSSLADDRVFAELFRMAPYDGSTVRKGVIPYAHQESGATPLVAPNGATGSVLVNPFRAVVGSRTAVSTHAKANWRDVRSAIAIGGSTLGQVVSFTANSSGNPRFDLVYAAVAVDANTSSVTRKRKDPTTKVISTASVVTRLATTVSVGVQVGTPGASPAWPAVPSDAGGVYYVPLAYVRIETGFGASSTVFPRQIANQAPVLSLSRAAGALAVSPATSQYTLTGTQQEGFGAGGNRPSVWMPPDMTGGQSLLIALDLEDASSANWSHQHNGVVDSRDWRNRLTRWSASVRAGASAFEWNAGALSLQNFPGPAAPMGFPGGRHLVGHGTTFTVDGSPGSALRLAGSHLSEMDDSSFVSLYADAADGGKLKVSITGTPLVKIFAWVDFSGPYSNFF